MSMQPTDQTRNVVGSHGKEARRRIDTLALLQALGRARVALPCRFHKLNYSTHSYVSSYVSLRGNIKDNIIWTPSQSLTALDWESVFAYGLNPSIYHVGEYWQQGRQHTYSLCRCCFNL